MIYYTRFESVQLTVYIRRFELQRGEKNGIKKIKNEKD